jgi:NADH-quinone oxidoreductase subunit A
MFGEFLPILILVFVAGLVCAAMVTLSYVLGPKKVTSYKSSPYECGVMPLGDANERFPIKFYLVGILFVLFDIEVVFLWSWLTVFKGASIDFQIFSAIDVFVYLAFWIIGYVYIVKIGALDWDEATSLAPEKLGPVMRAEPTPEPSSELSLAANMSRGTPSEAAG